MDHPVIIHVKTQYLPDHEAGAEGHFVFAYHVTIHNQGKTPITLKNRYWLITDGNGKQNEVSGPGVVGKQPKIEPGDIFSYSSGAVIETPVGTMQGYYEMEKSNGETFQAPIDVFGLAVPQSIH